jgi:arsenate reductase
MAAGFLNASCPPIQPSRSSNPMPTEHVNPVVVEAMLEKHIDIRGSQPKVLAQEMADGAHQVITMGYSIEEACPATFMLTEDWELDDPAGQSMDKVRRIRDQIEQKVNELITRES